MSCGVGCRRGSDPKLLWLWHRLAAIAPIRPLAWEPLYAAGVVLKGQKTKKKKKRKKERKQYPTNLRTIALKTLGGLGVCFACKNLSGQNLEQKPQNWGRRGLGYKNEQFFSWQGHHLIIDFSEFLLWRNGIGSVSVAPHVQV